MAVDVVIEVGARDVIHVNLSRDDGLAAEVRAGDDIAERPDDDASTSHQHVVRLVRNRVANVAGILAPGEVLAGRQNEAPSLERDMLHRWDPGVTVVRGRRAVKGQALAVHGHPE